MTALPAHAVAAACGIVVLMYNYRQHFDIENDYVTMLGLSCCYWFYTLLWLWPGVWVKLNASVSVSADPSKTMSYVAHACKVYQAYLVFTLCYGADGSGFIMPNFADAFVIAGIVIIVAGQVLNVGVMSALGVDGVYYGIRFGKSIPWCRSFPYNIPWMRDPQYVGSILTITGTRLLVGDAFETKYVVWLVLCYLYMSVVESKEYTPRVRSGEHVS